MFHSGLYRMSGHKQLQPLPNPTIDRLNTSSHTLFGRFPSVG
jgi:hypothetical protein